MARHKKMETVEEDAPALDISSLIDVCFLLLIYFLVATTMVKEQKLDMEIPSAIPSGDPPKMLPANIRIDSNGTVVWGASGSEIPMETDPNQHELATLTQQLEAARQNAEGTGEDLVVLLTVRNDVKNQRVVDVMNALSRAKITTVGLVDMKED